MVSVLAPATGRNPRKALLPVILAGVVTAALDFLR